MLGMLSSTARLIDEQIHSLLGRMSGHSSLRRFWRVRLGEERRLELEAHASFPIMAEAPPGGLSDPEDPSPPPEAIGIYKGLYLYRHPDPNACHFEPKGNANV
jgi:hypothetical protein